MTEPEPLPGGCAPAAVFVAVMIVFALLWFHWLLPLSREQCVATAYAQGFDSAWLGGATTCHVSLDGGRTWVELRDWNPQ